LQRVATLLVYLNDMKESGGGATQFKDLPVKVTPKRGTALLFFPAFADGEPDPRTVHAGRIITSSSRVLELVTACA
jgi:prolyl 4-hydroxylase